MQSHSANVSAFSAPFREASLGYVKRLLLVVLLLGAGVVAIFHTFIPVANSPLYRIVRLPLSTFFTRNEFN